MVSEDSKLELSKKKEVKKSTKRR